MKELHEIAALVHRESGILLRAEQHDALVAALERIDASADPARFLDCSGDPIDGPRHVSRLLDEITVKETYFFREAEQLERIRWHALLARAHESGRNEVRIWSAACATGEEPYSLALLACEAFPNAAPPVTILATDISPQALERARAGVYRPRSTRELDVGLHGRYFAADGDRLIAGGRLRSLVTFARHNLIHDPAPPLGELPFDLILCRNVLIYFDGETVDRVVAALEGALAPGGTLCLGAADVLCRGAGRLRALTAPAEAPSRPRVRALRRPLGRLAEDGASATTRPPADPHDAQAHFLRALAELEAGDPAAAVELLRRALYADPRFGLAAFQLGRAYEALGNSQAARRSYRQALRSLDRGDEHHDEILDQVGLDDVAAACEARLAALPSEARA